MKTVATSDHTQRPRHGTRLSSALIRAYVSAHYEVELGLRGIPFHIGVRCPRLEQQLRRRGVAQAAFLTAYNPWGRRLNRFANRRLQMSLQRHLQRRGRSWLPGFGCGPDWAAEPSLMVYGVGRRAGDEIARQFRQQGWVLIGTNHAPKLVLLR